MQEKTYYDIVTSYYDQKLNFGNQRENGRKKGKLIYIHFIPVKANQVIKKRYQLLFLRIQVFSTKFSER